MGESLRIIDPPTAGSPLLALATFTLQELAKQSATPVSSLWHIAKNAERHYRFGDLNFCGGKVREISAPGKRLKAIQKSIARELVRRIPALPPVCSAKERGVLVGARQHLGRAFISTRDLKRAFPSTSCARVERALLSKGIPQDAGTLVRQLTTVRGSLPQGAPTSNVLLDLVLSDLDFACSELAIAHGAKYTRFADDLTFSAHRPIDVLMRLVEAAIEGVGFHVTPDKRNDYREGDGQPKVVTGVVIGPTLSLPPRFVSETEYFIQQGALGNWAAANREQITGRIAWIANFDPERAESLCKSVDSVANRGGRRAARKKASLRFRPATAARRQTDRRPAQPLR